MKNFDLVCVSCCGEKLPGVHPAADLYQSQLFKASARYAKLVGKEWGILSAKWGFLRPDQLVAAYDLSLNDIPKSKCVFWRANVVAQLRGRYAGKRIMILAGERYCFGYPGEFDETNVSTPLDGMGIGKRLSALKKWTAELEQQKNKEGIAA